MHEGLIARRMEMAAGTDIESKEDRASGLVKVKNIGLRGVTVADTKISYIDGVNGILIYRGYRIEELAEQSSFEETAYLLLYDKLPDSAGLRAFIERLKQERGMPGFVINALRAIPVNAAPMDVLQAAVPVLAAADPTIEDDSREANLSRAVRLIARLPVVVAAWHRISRGLEPVSPDDALSHAENFLWMLHARRPDEDVAKDFDTALVLHADHTFNPSTFACREVVSTRAHMYAGVAAGIGALSGSLHGGANAEVMKMLIELREERDIAGWVKDQLDKGNRIMGMGHPVYKTMDPRAAFLKKICERLGRKTGQGYWCDLSDRIEEAAIAEFEKRGKPFIRPNVDFYSAPVYHLMGIPADMMTPVFAISRIAGWTAHIIEEKFGDAQERPTLYRPASEYVGNYCGKTGCAYIPLERRSG